jgi:hypothetical protein
MDLGILHSLNTQVLNQDRKQTKKEDFCQQTIELEN